MLGKVYMAYNNNYGNAYHVLLEWARALWTFRELSLSQLGYTAVLPASHKRNHYLEGLIAYLDLSQDIRWMDDLVTGGWWELRQLVYPRILSSDNFDYRFPQQFADFYAAWTAYLTDLAPTAEERRIYISRRDSPSRRLLNEPEIESLVEEYGFSVHTVSGMNLFDIASLFSSASCVVAPHGAGLANLVFHSGPRSILELMPSTYVNPCFQVISEGLRHEHSILLGDVLGDALPQKALTFTVDIRELEVHLRALG